MQFLAAQRALLWLIAAQRAAVSAQVDLQVVDLARLDLVLQAQFLLVALDQAVFRYLQCLLVALVPAVSAQVVLALADLVLDLAQAELKLFHQVNL